MHTWNGKDSKINYNSDLSGNLIITGKETSSWNAPDITSVQIPAEDILEFVGACLKDRKISEIESMSGLEYLDRFGIK